MRQPRDGRQVKGKLEKGCEGGRGGGPGCQERCGTRRRPEVAGREDSMLGAAVRAAREKGAAGSTWAGQRCEAARQVGLAAPPEPCQQPHTQWAGS